MDDPEELLFQKGFDTLATEAHEKAMFEGGRTDSYLDAVDNCFPMPRAVGYGRHHNGDSDEL